MGDLAKSFVLVVFILTFLSAVSGQEIKGSNFETSCESDNVCTTTIYSYEKYFYDENNGWQQIDESWHDCSTESQERFCSNEYYFEATAKSDGEIVADDGQEILSLKLTDFLNRTLNFNPDQEDSVVNYPDIINNVDLRYQYLPRKLKEEIVINSPIDNLPGEDFDITFTKSGQGHFVIQDSIICDFNEVCETIPTRIDEDQIILTIPVEFLNDPDIEYPIIIDPTIQLNDSSIAWNGYVHNSSNNYTRFDNPSQISLSSDKRGGIDWDISSISDLASISNLTLQIFVSAASTPYNISIMHMEGNSSKYANTNGSCQGNCNFWKDMGNGTEYNQTKITLKSSLNNFTLVNGAISDFESALTGNYFSIGMITDYSGTSAVSAKDNPTATQRPILIITHSYESHNLTYDANGNLIRGFGKYLEYDGWHRVSRVRQNNASGNIIEEYTYDHEGNRLKKVEYSIDAVGNNRTTYYISDEFVHIRLTNGTWYNETYYHLNGKLIAMKDGAGNKLYYHPDHLGSTTLVTNQSGEVVEDDTYLPFGAIYSGLAASRFLYAGKERDLGTGFDYLGARYYDSEFMHFLQPDSIIVDQYDPQNLNRYAYVLNNPYKYVDPSGNIFVLLEIFFGVNIESPSAFPIRPLFSVDEPVPVPVEAELSKTVKTSNGANRILDPSENIAENIVGKISKGGNGNGFLKGFKERIDAMEDRFTNIKNEEMSEGTIEAAGREMEGGQTPDTFGKPRDHVQKYKQGKAGLENQLEDLKNSFKDTRLSESLKEGIKNKIIERGKFLNSARDRLNWWRWKFRK